MTVMSVMKHFWFNTDKKKERSHSFPISITHDTETMGPLPS